MKASDILDWACTRLAGLPAVFWGPVIAAVIAVCGVILSNRHSRKQISIQLATMPSSVNANG
jgi:hypothetical protein